MGALIYKRLIKEQFIIKTDFLNAIEEIANRSSIEDLRKIGEALKEGVSFNDLLEVWSQGAHQVSKKELDHVARDWFDPKTGWWRKLKPAEKMRDGLLTAIQLRTENARNGRPLPVAYFWSPNATTFQFVPLLSEHQLTVVLLTPPEPKSGTTPTRAKTVSKVRARTPAPKKRKRSAKR